jgi:hypothetical protein
MTFTPRSLAVLVIVGHEFLADSLNVEQALSHCSGLECRRNHVAWSISPASRGLPPERRLGHSRDLRDTTNQPLQIPPAIEGIPLMTTTSVPSGFDKAAIPNTQGMAAIPASHGWHAEAAAHRSSERVVCR